MPQKFRTDVALMDMESGEKFADEVRLIYLQLPLFNKKLEDCENNFDKWICVLKDMDILERLPFPLKGEIFKKLAMITDVASLSKEERVEYDRAMKELRDTELVLESTRLDAYNDGRTKEKLAIAKSLKMNGISIDIIQKSTGLSKEEIENL
jgi:predicted transposase/invertase (TIGR01784 family)